MFLNSALIKVILTFRLQKPEYLTAVCFSGSKWGINTWIMVSSEKGILTILLGGLAYATIRLGDELVVFIARTSDEVGVFAGSIVRGLGDLIQVTNIGLDTIILLLVAIFLLFAIYDYVGDELD